MAYDQQPIFQSRDITEFFSAIIGIAAADRLDNLISSSIVQGAIAAKLCSKSQGQPVTGVRSAAVISIRCEISREGGVPYYSRYHLLVSGGDPSNAIKDIPP